MKYLTDQFDLTMVYLSKMSMIRCKKIEKEDIPICEVIPLVKNNFTSHLIENLFEVHLYKNNIHIMIGENDILYYMEDIEYKVADGLNIND